MSKAQRSRALSKVEIDQSGNDSDGFVTEIERESGKISEGFRTEVERERSRSTGHGRR